MAREWLDTVVGPDGDRVTFIIEPRLDRLFRGMDDVAGYTSVHFLPSLGEVLSRAFPGDKQRALVKNAWLLRMESDSGKRATVRAASHDDAVTQASVIAEKVRSGGSKTLSELD